MQFSLVVTTWNAAPWIGRCIQSIAKQQTRWFWQCLIIDDASDDGTQEAISSTLKSIQDPEIRDRFFSHRNSQNRGPLANFVHGFSKLGTADRPMDVLIQIDGDDWLYSDSSLETVAQTYEQTDCWLTYGGMITYPEGILYSTPVSASIIAESKHREAPWTTSHLRSCRSHLWHAIRDEDLRDQEGQYYKTTGDMAVMLPMVEMAGERIQCINKEIYAYNTVNPQSVHVGKRSKQLHAELEIRQKSTYPRLTQAQSPKKERAPQNEICFLILNNSEPNQSTELIHSIKSHYGNPRIHYIYNMPAGRLLDLPATDERLTIQEHQSENIPDSHLEAETIINGLRTAINHWSTTEWFAVIDHETHPVIKIEKLLATLISSPYDGYLDSNSSCMVLRRSAVTELLRLTQKQALSKSYDQWEAQRESSTTVQQPLIHSILCKLETLSLHPQEICWEDSETGETRILNKQDWVQINSNDCWFARRFTTPESSGLIDKIHGYWMLTIKSD